ncbi:MAG: cellulose binding domain-containing protein [Firmicutes bacterium]|nr:cellulose binding domain-containing protein [Bacillota bacterium]
MHFKKALSLFMSAVLLSSSMSLNVFAEDTAFKENTPVIEDSIESGGALVVKSSDIDVEFNITGQWNDGFTGEITIKNISDTLIEDWQVEMSFPHEIETIWNAKIESHEDGVYNIKNAGDNNNINIPVGGSVTFGFKAKHNGEITEPFEIYLVTTKRTAEKELYTTDFQLLNDWGSSFTAQITITNNTNDDIEGWHLLFNFDKEMSSIWNAVIESYENGRYTISNAEYNSVIPANGNVTFGFIGTPGNVENKPSKFDLIESNNNDKLFISFDDSSFLNTNDKFYLFSKLDKLNGSVYSLYGLKELNYTISYGDMKLASDGISVDKKGNWTISPATLMWESGYDEIGNVITVEAEDLRGNKAKNSIKIYNHYIDDDLFTTLDYGDNDGDGLLNYEETIYGTDSEIIDTDGDELNDYYEIKFSYTNPLEKDTDENGINDGDEDFDNDTLSNKEEVIYSSDPHTNDTDGDGLKDNEEIKHNTNVWMSDTDNDGLFDPLELELGTDPLNPDTNSNGILDGDESYSRTITPENDDVDERVVPTLEISAAPNLINTVEVSKVTDTVFLVEEMPGFLGSGYDFEMAGTFDTAKLTFKFDSSYLNIPEFNPTIYYFNEVEQVFEPLDNQNVDLNNCTVSTDLEHFSQYILLNRTAFEKAWEEDIIAPVSETALGEDLNVVLCIDSSESVNWNDESSLRKKVAVEFINSLKDSDKVAVVDFDHYAKTISGLTNNKVASIKAVNTLDANGGTNLSAGINESLKCFEGSDSKLKFIIMLTDGDGSYSDYYTTQAVKQGVKIYTVGLTNNVSAEKLSSISSATGGKYYQADKAADLINEFKLLTDEILDLTTDTDEDGISDYHEIRLRLCNGTYIRTEPDTPDTDGDTLKDGDEVIPVFLTENSPHYVNGNKYFKVISNPIKYDSDNDGLADYMEANYKNSIYLNVNYENEITLTSTNYTNNNWQLPNGYTRLKSTLGYMYTKPLKGDTDGDGLTDKEELGNLIEINGEKYYKLKSNPMVIDSDYDGIDDKSESNFKLEESTEPTGIDSYNPVWGFNNPLKYNYDPNSGQGYGLHVSLIAILNSSLEDKKDFVRIGSTNFYTFIASPRKKIIWNSVTNKYYLLLAKCGNEVRGGTIDLKSGKIRGCHNDEIYVEAYADTSVYTNKTVFKNDNVFTITENLWQMGYDAINGNTGWNYDKFLYFDSSENCCYTYDTNTINKWKNLHWYERFWLNAEYDRFLPFDSNVINKGYQSLIGTNNLLDEGKTKYHNPNYNNKYCTSDGLEGIYSKNGEKVALLLGNKYFDSLYKNGNINYSSIHKQNSNHTSNCVDSQYDACMEHGPTFNYCPPDDNLTSDKSAGHYYFDMLPYYWWNNCL